MRVFHAGFPEKDLPQNEFYAIVDELESGSNYFGQPWTDVRIRIKRNQHLIHDENIRFAKPRSEAVDFVRVKLANLKIEGGEHDANRSGSVDRE